MTRDKILAEIFVAELKEAGVKLLKAPTLQKSPDRHRGLL
jgi:hypothetical protein